MTRQWWKEFVDKRPKLARWIREGGLFILVSNLITVFKYLLLTFLPAAFDGLADGGADLWVRHPAVQDVDAL